MTESRKIVWKQTAVIAVGELVCLGVMFGIYALLHKLALPVILGGVVGTALAIGNFFFMAVAATLAADKAEKQDVSGGTNLMRASYPLRLLVIGALLLLCGFSGYFDLIALVLPLAFVRPVITLSVFFRKGG